MKTIGRTEIKNIRKKAKNENVQHLQDQKTKTISTSTTNYIWRG
jgi:hypothetical protein